MANVTLQVGDVSIPIVASADLSRFADPAIAAVSFHIADAAIHGALDKPVAALGNPDAIDLSVDHGASWTLGTPAHLSLGLTASASCKVVVKNSGELFRYSANLNGSSPTVVAVPAGKCYLGVELAVSLGVSGGAAYSSGLFGVRGSLSSSTQFRVANYKCFDQSTTLRDALAAAFNGFKLPFKADGLDALNDGDYLDYQFVGNLRLGMGASYGFTGALLGGRSTAEINSALSAPLVHSMIAVRPTYTAGATFAVEYDREDFYRVVLSRVKTGGLNRVNLFLFKLDASSLGLDFNLGVTANAGVKIDFQSQLNYAIGDAATRLFADAPADVKEAATVGFTKLMKAEVGQTELVKYVQEKTQKINSLIQKVGTETASLDVTLKRAQNETALFNYQFDLDQPAAFATGLSLALAGDFRAAMQVVPGVTLMAGSYIENLYTQQTGVTFQFFHLLKITQATEYFDDCRVVYAGNGRFLLLDRDGKEYDSSFGSHQEHVEVFFTLDASTSDWENVTKPNIKLNFVIVDSNNPTAAQQTVRALQSAAGNSDLTQQASRLATALAQNNALVVKATCVLQPSAYGRIQCNDFAQGYDGPPPDNQALDQQNWTAFVNAVNRVVASDGFQRSGFPPGYRAYEAFVLWNRTANDQEQSTKPGNRRSIGNVATWPSAWAAVDQRLRPLIVVFLNAGRSFMNLCEDLKDLAQEQQADLTTAQYTDLLQQLKDMVREDVAVWFTKPTLAALLDLTHASITLVHAPDPGLAVGNTFELTFAAA